VDAAQQHCCCTAHLLSMHAPCQQCSPDPLRPPGW
jgi:hypothetical protein